MSEQALDNLDYGYNWSTETWHVYQNEGAPLATVATEEYAALFAAAPGQAERIAEFEARAVDINNELRAEQRAHDFTKSDCIKLLEALGDCNSFIDELTHDLVEIERDDPMSRWYRPAMDLLERSVLLEIRLKREENGDEAESQQ